MSVRVYTGRHTDPHRGSRPLRHLPAALAVLAVGLQVAWPLSAGTDRDRITVACVVLFASACACHALLVRGLPWALGWFALSAGVGLAAEAVGLRTGLPFGNYFYDHRLGPTILAVPVVIPLAWAMMSYPCLLAARRLSRHPIGVAAIGGVALAAWDLFLDPQMVGEGQWVWHDVAYTLPGIPHVPLQNFLGWLLVAVVLMLLLDRLPRRRDDGAVPPDAVPAALLAWTYVSNVMLALMFEHRPAVALWGGLVMGVVVVPYAVLVATDPP